MTTRISQPQRSVPPREPQAATESSGNETLETVQKVVDFSISTFEAFVPGSKKTLDGVKSFLDKTIKALEGLDSPSKPAKKAAKKTTAKKTTAKKSAKQEVRYTVKKGDTLWDIGRRYGVSYQSIAKANHIKNPDLIYPGQTFVIPNGHAPSSRRSAPPSPSHAPSPSPSQAPGKTGSWSPGPGRLQGADTSHWQSDATFEKSIAGSQFSAIKATEGTDYTDPDFQKRWNEMGKRIDQGKMTLRIAYQFMRPGNGRAQADHFLNTLGIHGKLPAGTRLALDWEAQALSDPKALHDAAQRIHEVTGNWPLIYTSASQVSRAKAAAPQAPLWVAKWSSSIPSNVPFVQYSDGPGYDHDVFNGDLAALRKFAGF